MLTPEVGVKLPYTLCLHFFDNTSAKVGGGGQGGGYIFQLQSLWVVSACKRSFLVSLVLYGLGFAGV